MRTNYTTNNNESRKIIFIAGIVLIALGVICAIWNIIKISRMDAVSAEYTIEEYVHKGRKGKTAYVSYEYDNVQYDKIGLHSFNAFTMKDGKKTTVYLMPSHPDSPNVLSFEWVVIFLIFGGAAVFVTKKNKKE